MRLDAHQHFWKYSPERHAWIDDRMQVIRRDFMPGNLAPELANAGIEGCVAVQADETEAETHFLLDLALEHDFIQGVVGWTDFKAPDISDRLAQWKAFPRLKGFRAIMQGQPDEKYLTNRAFIEGVGQLERNGFTYDLLVHHDQLPSLIRFTEKFPDQPFILDHIAKPDIANGRIKPWKEHMKTLAQHPGIYCKLSGMVTEADWKNWRYEDLAPYLEIAGECFGTDRLCFGTDWPVCLLAGEYQTVKAVMDRFLGQVTEAEREQIWGTNASKFYNID
jgi:L-fuconolactonase